MSEIMLHGILNMPLPSDPKDCDIVTWVQFKAAARDASTRIKELEAKLQNQTHLIGQLFALLDITEETDDGRSFKPVHINCSRVMDAEKMQKVLVGLKRTLKGSDFDIESLDPDERSWYYDGDGTKRKKE